MSNLDIRQSIVHASLDQITSGADHPVHEVLAAINSELTMPLRMSVASGTTMTIGAFTVANPETGRNRSAPPINGKTPAFTGSTVTFPSTTGSITFSSSGSPVAFTIGSNLYYKILFYIDEAGLLGAIVGTGAASAAAAVVPTLTSYVQGIGYVVVHSTGTTLDAITSSSIYQYAYGSNSATPLVNDLDRGEINYVANGSFSNGSLIAYNPLTQTDVGWSGYNDGASATPVDGIGGTGWGVLSVDATGLLNGPNCLKYAIGATGSAQGNGFSYSFTLPAAYRSVANSVQFTYRTTTNYVSGDMIVSLFDVDSNMAVTTTTLAKADTPAGTTIFFFWPFNTASSNYRIIFHTATASALGWNFYLDDVLIGSRRTVVATTYSVSSSSYTVPVSGERVVVLCDTTSNNITLNLPSASGHAGMIIVKKTAGTGIITLDPYGSQTVDGFLTYPIGTLYQCETLVSTGSNWILV